MYERKECDGGIGENLMERIIVLWREFQKDPEYLGMLKPFFWIEGGGCSVEQGRLKTFQRVNNEPDGSKSGVGLACDKRARNAYGGQV